ncbi:MAG: hypothetical protein O6932_04225, partial [Gammaproteobacteria bacterium]|nr:hypothetical protein [Gammaproteobacteria bacterium]
QISVIPASEPGSRVAESKQFTGSRVKPGMTMLLIYSDFTLKAVPFVTEELIVNPSVTFFFPN